MNNNDKTHVIALLVVTILGLISTGLLTGILALPRLWLTNPNVIISDKPVIGFYDVKISGLDEGETIELKKAPAKNVVHLSSRLNADSMGYFSTIVVNNNKIKVFNNNTEAFDYNCSTDLRMSNVFNSKNFLYSDCHAKIKLYRGQNKIVVISGNAMKTFYLNIN